jgi:hypothetical protein
MNKYSGLRGRFVEQKLSSLARALGVTKFKNMRNIIVISLWFAPQDRPVDVQQTHFRGEFVERQSAT